GSSQNRAIAAPATANATAEPASSPHNKSCRTMNANQPLLSRMAGLFAARAGLYSASALIVGVFGIAALSAVAQLEFRGTVDGRLDSVTAWHSMTFANQLIFIFGL